MGWTNPSPATASPDIARRGGRDGAQLTKATAPFQAADAQCIMKKIKKKQCSRNKFHDAESMSRNLTDCLLHCGQPTPTGGGYCVGYRDQIIDIAEYFPKPATEVPRHSRFRIAEMNSASARG
jgi:hypothetical protein